MLKRDMQVIGKVVLSWWKMEPFPGWLPIWILHQLQLNAISSLLFAIWHKMVSYYMRLNGLFNYAKEHLLSTTLVVHETTTKFARRSYVLISVCILVALFYENFNVPCKLVGIVTNISLWRSFIFWSFLHWFNML